MDMVAPIEVGICCRDLDRLVEFYVNQLSFELVSVIDVAPANAREAALSDGAYRVARLQTPWGERLKLLEPAITPEPGQPVSWILGRQNAGYLTFIVRDLQAQLALLLAAGMEILTGDAPVEVRPGVWLVFGRDPEGNYLEFVQYRDIAAYRSDLGAGADGAAGLRSLVSR